jgi:hypothetical protein
MTDIIDRNLYPDADAREHASSRLGVILDSYTVYLDLGITDASGTVLSNARSGKYHGPHVSSAGSPHSSRTATSFIAMKAAASKSPRRKLGRALASRVATGPRSAG